MLPIFVTVLSATWCFAQGTVTFANNVMFHTPTEPGTDRLVRNVDGSLLVGTNFVAQLYYGADANSLRAVTAAPAHFKPPTTTQPGTWLGTTRMLEGVFPGQTVSMVVRVWDTDFGLTFDAAKAAGGAWGESAPFSYYINAVGPPASVFLMENFRGFTLVPEPSAALLLSVAVGSVLLLRLREKQCRPSRLEK